jgi:hypothetical protein
VVENRLSTIAMSTAGAMPAERDEETMNRTKKVILGLLALLMLSFVTVSAWAGALPAGLSDRMTVAGSNGGGNNCTGNNVVNILEGKNGHDTYKNGVSAVVCNGKYGFGPFEKPGHQYDFLSYAVTGKMRSDSGPEPGGVDKGESDLITITITAYSYPDGSPLSDLLTVTVKDSMGLYNNTMSVPIHEHANGSDDNQVSVDLATLTGGFHSFGGDCCDSVALTGAIRLQSIPGPPTGDPNLLEVTTEVIQLGAYSDATPEPGTMALLGTGLLGVAGLSRLRKNR